MPGRATSTPSQIAKRAAPRAGEYAEAEAARARLSEEEREYDEAARTRLASSMLTRPIVDRSVNSAYLMSVRFNRLLDTLDEMIGLANKSVLSCGCGAGIYEIAFAGRGARVFAYDISGGMLEIAKHNANVHDVEVTWFKSDEYALADDLASLGAPAFDLIFGASILHHLADPSSFLRAIAGASGPNAAAAFIEPLATPLVELARRSRLNRARRHQTSQELVWSKAEYIAFLSTLFDSVSMHGSLNLASGLHRVLTGRRWAGRAAPSAPHALQYDALLSRIPGMGLCTWHGTFIATHPQPARVLGSRR